MDFNTVVLVIYTLVGISTCVLYIIWAQYVVTESHKKGDRVHDKIKLRNYFIAPILGALWPSTILICIGLFLIGVISGIHEMIMEKKEEEDGLPLEVQLIRASEKIRECTQAISGVDLNDLNVSEGANLHLLKKRITEFQIAIEV